MNAAGTQSGAESGSKPGSSPVPLRTPRIHTCDVCGKQALWGSGWAYFGSIESEPPRRTADVVVCSDECHAAVDRCDEQPTGRRP